MVGNLKFYIFLCLCEVFQTFNSRISTHIGIPCVFWNGLIWKLHNTEIDFLHYTSESTILCRCVYLLSWQQLWYACESVLLVETCMNWNRVIHFSESQHESKCHLDWTHWEWVFHVASSFTVWNCSQKASFLLYLFKRVFTNFGMPIWSLEYKNIEKVSLQRMFHLESWVLDKKTYFFVKIIFPSHACYVFQALSLKK